MTTKQKHELDDESKFLAASANDIRKAGKRAIGEIILIGGKLTEVEEKVGRARWLQWLHTEFRGWSEMQAGRFMHVHAMANSSSNNLLEMNIDISALYLVAAPSTPDEVRAEVLERAAAGERIKHGEVRGAIAKVRVQSTPAPSAPSGPLHAPPSQQGGWAFGSRRIGPDGSVEIGVIQTEPPAPSRTMTHDRMTAPPPEFASIPPDPARMDRWGPVLCSG
jgi:hypothetical protein